MPDDKIATDYSFLLYIVFYNVLTNCMMSPLKSLGIKMRKNTEKLGNSVLQIFLQPYI